MFFVIMRQKTLKKLISKETEKAVNNSYTLGFHYGKMDERNRNLCGLPLTKIDFFLEEVLKNTGFDKEGEIGYNIW